MADDQGKGVREFFLEYVKRYESYHSAKETLVWLAATVYMGFAGATMNWLMTTNANWTKYRPWLGVGIGVVCFLLSWFLWFQNGYKASSKNVSDKLDDWLPKFDDKKQPTFTDLHSTWKCANEMQFHRWKNGKAGCVLLILVIVLGIAQILVVSWYPGP